MVTVYRERSYPQFKPYQYKVSSRKCISISDENDHLEMIHVPDRTRGIIVQRKRSVVTIDFVYECGYQSSLFD